MCSGSFHEFESTPDNSNGINFPSEEDLPVDGLAFDFSPRDSTKSPLILRKKTADESNPFHLRSPGNPSSAFQRRGSGHGDRREATKQFLRYTAIIVSHAIWVVALTLKLITYDFKIGGFEFQSYTFNSIIHFSMEFYQAGYLFVAFCTIIWGLVIPAVKLLLIVVYTIKPSLKSQELLRFTLLASQWTVCDPLVIILYASPILRMGVPLQVHGAIYMFILYFIIGIFQSLESYYQYVEKLPKKKSRGQLHPVYC
jgi:hypothetical protein